MLEWENKSQKERKGSFYWVTNILLFYCTLFALFEALMFEATLLSCVYLLIFWEAFLLGGKFSEGYYLFIYQSSSEHCIELET